MMKLREFLAKTGMPKTELARRSGATVTTIHNLLRGGNIRLDIAVRISEATEWQVRPEELLPEKDEKKSRKKS